MGVKAGGSFESRRPLEGRLGTEARPRLCTCLRLPHPARAWSCFRFSAQEFPGGHVPLYYLVGHLPCV